MLNARMVDDTSVNPCETNAVKYLKEHRILDLFENLTAALVFNRPEDPKAFMREHIEQLQKAKSNPEEEPPSFIDEANIKSVFNMLDITKKGHITREQYLQAMKSMGVGQFNENPAGAELNRISQNTFVRESKAALRAAMATFLDY